MDFSTNQNIRILFKIIPFQNKNHKLVKIRAVFETERNRLFFKNENHKNILNFGKALTQCDSLEDLKLHLSGTSYSTFLNDEAGVINASLIGDRLRDKLVAEFEHMTAHSSGNLTRFLDFIRYQ